MLLERNEVILEPYLVMLGLSITLQKMKNVIISRWRGD